MAGHKSSPTIRGSIERNRGNIPSFCYSGIKLVKHLNKDLRLNLLRSLTIVITKCNYTHASTFIRSEIPAYSDLIHEAIY